MSEELFAYAVKLLCKTRQQPDTACKICGAEARPFDLLDFGKSCNTGEPAKISSIPVVYRLCSRCRFIFTDFGDEFTREQWQRFVYNEEYTLADPEYLHTRPRHNAREIITFLLGRRQSTVGLDFGGGNGTTARLLRENGWVYDTYDPFGYTDMASERVGWYNFCSAIEVFEHSPKPIESLSSLLKLASPRKLAVLIGTSIHDNSVTQKNRLSWWYAGPRNGHVSLYSRKSLEILAAKFGLDYTSTSLSTHLMTREMSKAEALLHLSVGRFLRRARTGLRMWPENLV